MTSKHEKAQILQAIRDAGIDFSDTTTKDGVRKVAGDLAQLEFLTRSECGGVQVLHNGSSALVDIDISDDALCDYDSRQMAEVIGRTIRHGERTVREVLRSASGTERAS